MGSRCFVRARIDRAEIALVIEQVTALEIAPVTVQAIAQLRVIGRVPIGVIVRVLLIAPRRVPRVAVTAQRLPIVQVTLRAEIAAAVAAAQ